MEGYLVIGLALVAAVVFLTFAVVGQFKLEQIYQNLWDRMVGRRGRR
jgi:hypothetical protein